MIRDANIEIVQGDTEVVLIPIRDLDTPENSFVTPPDSTDIRYVIASDFESSLVVYEADNSQISTPDFGDVRPENPSLPDSFPTVNDTQSVIRIEISPAETRNLSVTEDNDDISSYVHECEIRRSTTPLRKVTIMQGSVQVLPSATSDTV